MRSRIVRLITAAALFGIALLAGFLVAGPLGGALLRSEAETRLARWLGGPVEIRALQLTLANGPGLVIEGIRGYRRSSGEAALNAERLVARLDGFSLLAGKIRLASLVVEGARLEIRHEPGGGWSPSQLFHGADEGEAEASSDDLEGTLAPLQFLDTTAHALLDESFGIYSVRVRDSSIRVLDARPRDPATAPAEITFAKLEADLVRDRFAGGAQLALRATLVADAYADSTLSIDARRTGGLGIEVAASFSDLPLTPAFGLLSATNSGTQAAGTLDIEFGYATSSPGSGTLELEAEARDLVVSVPLRAEPLHIESPELRLESELRLEPDHVELFETSISGLAHSGRLLLAGAADRPLRESTRIRFSVELRGAGLDQLKKIIAWLPRSDADPLERILARVSAGNIPSIGASGRIRVSEWKQLLRGQLVSLPRPFVLAAKVEELAVGSAFDNRLSGISGHAEWSGDRIELRGMRAQWNDEPLPVLDFSAEGVSNLFRGPDSLRTLNEPAPDLPGLEPLLAWLEGLPTEEDPAPSSVPAVRIYLDHLEHPGLRWPLRETTLRLTPIPNGAEWIVESGRWAGAVVEGEVLSIASPEPRWIASLRISPPTDPPFADPISALPGEWARGRLETASLKGWDLPIEAVDAQFSFRDTGLYFDEFQARVGPRGVLAAEAGLELDRREAVGFSIRAELRDGDLEPIARAAGLGSGFGTGTVDAELELTGRLAPRRRLLEDSRGTLSVAARDGEIAYELPLALAVAQATIGFNPFASREATRYDSIRVDIELEPGRVQTQNFELDGPLRVFAAGGLDVSSAPAHIDAVVGVFLLRQIDRALGKVPLLSNLISSKGLVGSYFEIKGPLEDPEVRSLPSASLAEAVPQFLKLPFEALGALPNASQNGPDSNPKPRGAAREKTSSRPADGDPP